MFRLRTLITAMVVILVVSPTVIRMGQRFDLHPNTPPRARLSNSLEVPPAPRVAVPDATPCHTSDNDLCVPIAVFWAIRTDGERPRLTLVIVEPRSLRAPPIGLA